MRQVETAATISGAGAAAAAVNNSVNSSDKANENILILFSQLLCDHKTTGQSHLGWKFPEEMNQL